MAPGSTSSGGSVSLGSLSSSGGSRSRRGLISCLHSLNCRNEDAPLPHDDDLQEATRELIVGFYDPAPLPDLYGILSTAGLCLGLLDPVSNIILNTLALLNPKTKPLGDDAAPPAAKTGSKKRHRPGFDPWHEVATRSCHSLMAFLVAYFGCINEEQAFRYLYRAGANLPLAVMLVQHDLYHAKPEALDPQSDRTGGRPPQQATIRPPPWLGSWQSGSKMATSTFSRRSSSQPMAPSRPRMSEQSTVLHMMMTPMCVANISNTNDGLVVHVRQNLDGGDDGIWSKTEPLVVSSAAADARITSTAFRWDGTAISSLQTGLPSKLLDCLGIADDLKHILRTPCAGGDACDYLQSLKMYLHGMIHNLYVQAFKLLPSPSGSLMRSILMAGHCYGPCDPLSNIILNSIWYDNCASDLSASVSMMVNECNDVLDPLSLLRLVVRSLEGLTNLALFADPQSSIACALEKLCSSKCVVSDMLSSATKNPFHEAAMAARHPLPFLLGEFHQVLLLKPDGRSKLPSHITKAQTSGGVLCVDDIIPLMSFMWSNFKTPMYETSGTVQALAPEVCVDADSRLRMVSSARSEYEERRSWLRSKIKQVLKDYTDQHFWGPKYKLDFIFGVEEIDQGRPLFSDTCYHVNFMATSDENVSRTPFYAELWSWPSHKPRTGFCCPLPFADAVGRCYYDTDCARKILYPDDAKYIPDDITHEGTGSVDGTLEMDLVHFTFRFRV
uniref:Uncharacterized protein n=1 Tax=Aegilops tauschii TaxID=37682 RepID=M8CXC9_AEGTA